MVGLGTWVNVLAIAIGSGIGWLVGQRLPARYSEIMLQALSPLVVVVGLQMALILESATQAIAILLAMVLGSVLGEWLNLEAGLTHLGKALEAAVTRWFGPTPLTHAFVNASIVFVVGPMAILGSLQDGSMGNPSLLLIKSALDGIASIAFTASLGIGTLFSILPVGIYQGSLTLVGFWLGDSVNPIALDTATATGGLLVMGVGLNLLQVTRLRLANMLPALPLVSLIALVLW